MTNKEIIEHLLSIKKWGILTDKDRQSLNLVIKELEERPTGEWIECEEWHETYYECSVCKEPWCTIEGTPAENLMNYCPCCGAKMQGVRKNEEEGKEE